MRNKEGQSQNSQDAGVSDVDAFQLMAFAFGDDPNLMEEDAANEADVERFGRYEILGELGSGGMGVVYRAKEKGIEREVALKVLVAGRFSTRELRERFLLEYKTVARLEHESIVPIYAVGEVDGLPYMAMRLIDGHSLSEFMQTGVWKAYSVKEKVRLFHVVAEAVCYAHQRGVIHRDIKPSNILVDLEGKPYLVDFGIAKSEHVDANLTMSGAVVGTPAYLAPEMLDNLDRGPTVLVDVYGLGALLYEMLTGKSCIQAKGMYIYRSILEQVPANPSSLDRNVDADLDTIVGKCLEKRPQDRYASAQRLLDDLDLWMSGFPILARKSSTLEKLRKYAMRKPLVAGMSLLSLVLSGVAITTMVVHSVRIAHKNEQIQIQSEELSQTHSDLLEVQILERQRYVKANYDAGIAAINEGDFISALPHWLELLELEKGDPEREFLHRLRIGILMAHCPRLISERPRQATEGIVSNDDKVIDGKIVNGRTFYWSLKGEAEVSIELPVRNLENMTKLDGEASTHYVESDRSKGYRLSRIFKSDDVYDKFLIDPLNQRALVYRGDSLILLDLTGEGRVVWSQERQNSTHVTSVQFSPNGERMFLGTENGQIEVLDAESGNVLRTFVWKDSPIVSLAVHESGELFVSGSEAGELVLWGMTQLRPAAPWLRLHRKVEGLEFLKQGIVRVQTRDLEQKWQLANTAVYGFNNGTSMAHDHFMLGQSMNGNGAFGMRSNRGKHVWVDYQANRELKEADLRRIDWKPVRDVQIQASWETPEGKRVVLIQNDGQQVVVRDGNGVQISMVSNLHEVTFVDFICEGKVVVTGTKKGEVRLWSAISGKVISPTLKNFFPVQDIRWNRDTEHLAVVTEGFIPVWRMLPESSSIDQLKERVSALLEGTGIPEAELSADEVFHWVRHQNSINHDFKEE